MVFKFRGHSPKVRSIVRMATKAWTRSRLSSYISQPFWANAILASNPKNFYMETEPKSPKMRRNFRILSFFLMYTNNSLNTYAKFMHTLIKKMRMVVWVLKFKVSVEIDCNFDTWLRHLPQVLHFPKNRKDVFLVVWVISKKMKNNYHFLCLVCTRVGSMLFKQNCSKIFVKQISNLGVIKNILPI